MAARHHASKRRISEHDKEVDRKNLMHSRSHHEERGHAGYYDEGYAGELARRTQEMQDAGMIRMEPSAIANLPQAPIIKPYPNRDIRNYMPEKLDDTIREVDGQMDADDRQRSRHNSPHKY